MDIRKSILATRKTFIEEKKWKRNDVGKGTLHKHDHVEKEEEDDKSKSSRNKRKMDDVSNAIRSAIANINKKKNNDMSEEEEEMSKLYKKSSKRKRNDTIRYVVVVNRRKMLKSEMPKHQKSLPNTKRKRNDAGEEILLSSVVKRRSIRHGSSYLSEDLIFNILSSTCVTSLLRCKSVCKLWLSIISKPEFMNAHHLNALSKLPSIMMITSTIADDAGHQGATIVYPNSPKQYSVDIPLMPPFHNLEFVNSFNGVVCVFNEFFGDLYLLNPLTRMTKKLTLPNVVATVTRRPRMIFSAPRGPYSASINYPPTPAPVIDNTPPLLKACKVDVGFGFDCVSNDFKVLFVEYRDTDNRHVDLAVVNLYSSNSDSWRSIEVGIDLPSLLYYPFCPVLRSGPVVDGVLYMEGADAIITFDLHNEMFGLISYPSSIHTRKSNVLDFEGYVAVVLETVPDGSLVERELSLWTLVAVSDEVVWNKMFTFGSGSEEIGWLFLYSGENQFFGKTRLREMLYDYRKRQTKYVRLPSQSFLVRVLNHTESFLSVEGFEGVKDS